MITQNEINTVELSANKKDFIQIWQELLEVSRKLSERIDPTQTNESDPLIVLLKVLTAIADKLNYTIDANTLEAFMPSAAQWESMKKLTDMLGYNMKYYRSATTNVKIAYQSANHDEIPGVVLIDRYSNIKNIDDTINYVTVNEAYISSDVPTVTVECIEGELVECESDNDNIITMLLIDDNNRYYLPEQMIAENGVFITNISDGTESTERWERVENLNTQPSGAHVFKFGFDASENLPYIQFPKDISTIIEDGLKIKYIRTNGANGNVSVNTLCQLETPVSWTSTAASDSTTSTAKTADYYNVENYNVSNTAASTNGANMESLNEAYNNFKRTVGTFDTLVTCRDYMNKIYQMTESETSSTPLVSNIIATDIRDDINKAIVLCTFTEHGTEYRHLSKKVEEDKVIKDLISHYDLILYPFRAIYGLNNRSEFENSFKYDNSTWSEITRNLENNKTLSHNFIEPVESDLACIKNYLNLNAKINTTRKVGDLESSEIIAKVQKKLYETFNMRQLEFGEEIPYDEILKTISNADTRIKSVILDEPNLNTVFCTVGGDEYPLTITEGSIDINSNANAKKHYNNIVLNNVLAGRINLFDYNTDFEPNYEEAESGKFDVIYPGNTEDKLSEGIYKVEPKLDIDIFDSSNLNLKLQENEVIQFRLPNLQTTKTYPAYVNYFVKLDNISGTAAIPATMQTINTFLTTSVTVSSTTDNDASTTKTIRGFNLIKDVNSTLIEDFPAENYTIERTNEGAQLTDDEFKAAIVDTLKKKTKEGFSIYSKDGSTKITATDYGVQIDSTINEYIISEHFVGIKEITSDTISAWYNAFKNLKQVFIRDKSSYSLETPDTDHSFAGIYVKAVSSPDLMLGYLVDNNYTRYKLANTARTLTETESSFGYYFVPILWKEPKSGNSKATLENTTGYYDINEYHTMNGLGQSAEYSGIVADAEYELKDDEYLLINYTQSSSDDTNQTTVINEYLGKGTIIKPNFNLIDSKTVNLTKSYNKTSGYSFVDYAAVETVPGMFTLGANEQIEVREIATVKLDQTGMYLYFIKANEQVDGDKKIHLFDEDELTYTLKEGEYLFYTDSNKIDFAYYGSGTLLTRENASLDVFKSTNDNAVSLNDILTYGLSANIPWRNYNLKNIPITITEYQYKNLIAGDTLNSIEFSENKESGDSQTINSTWVKVTKATYTIDEGESTSATPTSLPPVGLKDYNWEVAGKLELNVSPTTPQTIYYEERRDIYTKEASVTLISKKPDTSSEGTPPSKTPSVKITAKETSTPISFKTNAIIQSSSQSLDVTTKTYTSKGVLEDTEANLKVKVFKQNELRLPDDSALNLNNFGLDNAYTRIVFEKLTGENNTDKPYTSLNILLPENSFGLIMFYNLKTNYQDGEQNVAISSNIVNNLSIFNKLNNENKPIWWTEDDENTINPYKLGKTKENDNIQYLTTDTNPNNAMYITLAASSDGWTMQFENGKYIAVEDNTNYNKPIESDTPFVWTWNSKYHTFTATVKSTRKNDDGSLKYPDGRKIFLGTYEGTYGTISVCDEYRFEEGNYPLHLYSYTKVEASVDPDAPVVMETPVAGKYIGGLTANDGKNYYANGKVDALKYYYLRQGLNIVKIDKSCTLNIYPGAYDKDVLIFSNLDIINIDTDHKVPKINPRLDYQQIGDTYNTNIEQLLADIRKLDLNYNFYYNNIPTNDLVIDLNINNEDEKLSSPLIWYDKNNLANKFVISELNAESIVNNVRIAETSKR